MATRPDVPLDSFAELSGDIIDGEPAMPGGGFEAPQAGFGASAEPDVIVESDAEPVVELIDAEAVEPAAAPTVEPVREPVVEVAETPVEPAAGPPATTNAAPAPQRVRDYSDPSRAMHDLLQAVMDSKASDLHLIAGTRPLLRIHGGLTEAGDWASLTPTDVRSLVYAILPEAQRSRLETAMELDCAYSMPQSARFRLNVYYQRGSIAAAFRIIPFDILSVEELGLPTAVRSLARLTRGLVVVTGPTGVGKSTTLASMVDIVNRERQVHILTVEDPIEYLHKHGRSAISQREVGPDTHGFAEALKHALRQDPDVILVGEMRDRETIATAIMAAETGHLVFATLHTQDAAQTIDRIIGVFPPSQQQQVRVQLAITLQGVIAQQLLPSAEGRGRVVAAEVLVATPAVRNVIREGKTHQLPSAMQAGRKFGMVTMDAALANLVAEGKITRALAAQYAFNADELGRLMGVPVQHPVFARQ
ncbi:MAG TPA: type IV pilus twitching motility protein PilT [Actinomycetota bacterium]